MKTEKYNEKKYGLYKNEGFSFLIKGKHIIKERMPLTERENI